MSAQFWLSLSFSLLFILPSIFCRSTNLNIQEITEFKPTSGNTKLLVNTSYDFTYSNNSYNISYPSAENTTHPNIKSGDKNYPLLVSVLVISFLVILINARVFYLGTSEKRQKSRLVNIFVAHMSSIAIGFTFVLLIYVLEKSNVFSVTAPGLCELLSFLRHGLFCAFPLNAVAIIYARLTNSTSTSGKYFVIRAICLLWTIALIGSFPTIFMVEYSKNGITKQEFCKQILIFGSYELTLSYEVFRFTTFHLLECFYMAFALFQIRSKIRYLYILKPIPNDSTKKKVQRVRYIYVHSIIFILIWLPTGVAIGIYRVLSRKWEVDGTVKNYLTPLIFLSTSLYILSPLIYLLLHEDMSEVNFWEFSLFPGNRRRIQADNNKNNMSDENNGNDNRNRCIEKANQMKNKKNDQKGTNKRNILHEITDLSRISTVGVSTPVLVLQQSSTFQTEQQPELSRISVPVLQSNEAGELKTNDCVSTKKETPV